MLSQKVLISREVENRVLSRLIFITIFFQLQSSNFLARINKCFTAVDFGSNSTVDNMEGNINNNKNRKMSA